MGTQSDVKQGNDSVKQGDDVLAGPRGSSAAAFDTSHKAQVESMGLKTESEAPHGQDAPAPQRITEVPDGNEPKQDTKPASVATPKQVAKQDVAQDAKQSVAQDAKPDQSAADKARQAPTGR